MERERDSRGAFAPPQRSRTCCTRLAWLWNPVPKPNNAKVYWDVVVYSQT